jgi:hypothetical protein
VTERVLTSTMPADPLERFTTAEILAEIARRPGGPDALAAAQAAGDLDGVIELRRR